MELIPVKYCVTIEIRNSKLNLVIIKPPRLLSNLGGSLHPSPFAFISPSLRSQDNELIIYWSAPQYANGIQLVGKPTLARYLLALAGERRRNQRFLSLSLLYYMPFKRLVGNPLVQDRLGPFLGGEEGVVAVVPAAFDRRPLYVFPFGVVGDFF